MVEVKPMTLLFNRLSVWLENNRPLFYPLEMFKWNWVENVIYSRQIQEWFIKWTTTESYSDLRLGTNSMKMLYLASTNQSKALKPSNLSSLSLICKTSSFKSYLINHWEKKGDWFLVDLLYRQERLQMGQEYI